jgi:hypothetical protein
MTIPIRKFTIYGERSSGTNFLEKSIKMNFNLEVTREFGSKHFFCFDDCCKQPNEDTLFIGIIRNPVYWLNSFIQQPYHVPIQNRNVKGFLTNPFYSVHDEKTPEPFILNGNVFFSKKALAKNHEINMKDLNYITGKTYKNIFELRKCKNDYLMNIMPTKVKNYILINYEDLLYNYQQTLDTIKENFRLVSKQPFYIKSRGYKQSNTHLYKGQKSIIFSPQIFEFIWDNLDVEQEKQLGYFKGNNNNFFKDRYLVNNKETNEVFNEDVNEDEVVNEVEYLKEEN